MQKITVLIPLHYNNGEEVPEDVLENIFKDLVSIAGGYSIEGEVTGAWEDNGTIYKDRSLKVAIAGPPETLEEIQGYIKEIKEVLEQETMYVEVSTNTEVIFL